MSASRRLLIPVVRRHWGALAGAGLASGIQAVAELAQPLPLGWAIDRVIDGRDGPFRLDGGDVRLLWLLAAALVVISAVRATAGYAADILLNRAGERITHELRVATHAHLQRLSLSYHDRRQKGDLVQRLTADANQVGILFSESLGAIVQAVLLLAGMAAVALALDPPLALALFAVTPLLGAVTVRYRRRVMVAARRQRAHEGAIASLAAESLAAIRVVKAFGGEGYEDARVRRSSDERRRHGVEVARLEARFGGLVEVIGAATMAVVLLAGSYRVAAGALTAGSLVVFAAYARGLYRPLREIAKQSTRVSRAAARAERIAEVLAADEVVRDSPGAVSGPPARGHVRLEGVGFGYGGERPALTDLWLDVPPGTRLAVVGPSGAGKSTLAALVARFYDPQHGRVLVDGRDAREWSLEWLRRQVGVLLQDTILFSGTVAENIAYGLDATPEAIAAAARTAGADTFIERLPDGYDTELGPQGVGLSGGQRQRLGIARVLVRDPAILVLDEPTSGLDALSEAMVLDGLARLMHGRTTILVTHSLAVAAGADRVAVVDGGRIAQAGAPAALLARPGLYRTMAREQGLDGRRAAGDDGRRPRAARNGATAGFRRAGGRRWVWLR